MNGVGRSFLAAFDLSTKKATATTAHRAEPSLERSSTGHPPLLGTYVGCFKQLLVKFSNLSILLNSKSCRPGSKPRECIQHRPIENGSCVVNT